MTLYAKLKDNVGSYGRFQPRRTYEVSQAEVGWLRYQPEFDLWVERPDDDLRFRDEAGRVKHMGFYGPVDARFGYGGGGITILRALTHLGIEAQVNPSYCFGPTYKVYNPVDLPPDAAVHVHARRDWVPRWELAQCLPDAYPFWKVSRRIGWTMWEMDKIPDGSNNSKAAPFGDWAGIINEHTERLVVPCQHNAEVFANCGVKVPISVIPYGLDTEVWPYYDRPERETFTVVIFGDLSTRKGAFEAFQAFELAFPTEKDVRLIMKSQHNHFGLGAAIPVVSDPRVSFINDSWTRAQLVEFLHSADSFIWPSRGEGFGLPPLQAALTGLPVIMTTHTGMAEYYDQRYFYKIEDASKSDAPLYGQWIDPDVESTAAQLRYVYEHRKAALKKGKQAAAYVRRKFSLEAFGANLGRFLDTLD